MRPALFAILCLLVSRLYAAELKSLEIVPQGDQTFEGPRVISLAKNNVEVPLELTDSIEGVILKLRPATGGEFLIEQSFETSLTVMEEGPHLDLLDWKHHVSPWQPLKEVRPNEFLTRKIPDADRVKFPEVTPAEIQKAVTREGGKTLGRYVRNVRGPNDEPCGVGVSKISFRIKVKDGADWKVLRTVHFLVPLGC